MAQGTSNNYWADQNLPSKYKHELLRRYIAKFGGATGSVEKRIAYLDGFAGEGRYDSGEPGSAEIAMRVAADHLSSGLRWTCHFTERSTASVSRLKSVAAEYEQRGVDVHVYHRDVDGLLDEVVESSTGTPLFLFLDPCGLTLPFERLVGTLTGSRSAAWPPTELLMNFSTMAVRRLGGVARKGDPTQETGLRRMDQVCGGRWWRDVFIDASVKDPDEEVAFTYAKRLGESTGMTVVTIPVAKAPHHKPLYHLVFATRSPHGVWAVGDNAARAKEAWWETLELAAEDDGALFSVAQAARPDPEEVVAKAVPAIADNIEKLLQERGGEPFMLVDHGGSVFGEFFGQVTESAARKALVKLHKEKKVAALEKNVKTHKLTVRPYRE